MKVILTEMIESLGTVGDEVNVAKGYARNYLIPQKKAILATPNNRKVFERQREQFEQQLAKDQTKAAELAENIKGAVCTIVGRVSDGDRLYGSVTTRDIAEQLKEQGFAVDKKMVMLSEPIKTLGSFIVPIRLHSDILPEITVKVIPEQETQ